MRVRTLPFATAITSVTLAWPSIAANDQVVTGITNMGVGVFIISIAAALLLTLLFRATAVSVARLVTSRLGKRRLRRILDGRSANVLEDFLLPGA